MNILLLPEILDRVLKGYSSIGSNKIIVAKSPPIGMVMGIRHNNDKE